MRGIGEVWRQQGMRVSLVTDPTQTPDADLAILHVDLTVVPDEYLRLMQHYPQTINAGVGDISKRRISRNLVRDGDGYRGPVIVKTNRNYGGVPESHCDRRSTLQRYLRAARRRMHWSWRSELDVWKYPIFDSPSRVPLPVWFNPDLVVERFLPERSGDLYCMRMWTFLGDAEENITMFARQPIIKSRVAIRKEKTEVPPELRQMRRELGFDYGKFDYGIVDGRVVLYDANRTPVFRPTPENAALCKKLAAGIDSLLTPRYRAAG